MHNGVSHRCACVKLSTQGGASHHVRGVLASLQKYRAIWGIAISRDMGLLRGATYVAGPIWFAKLQKNPRVRKFRVRNSGDGNGCANFMDAWKNAFFLQDNLCP